MAAYGEAGGRRNFDWDRSISEPDLTAPNAHFNRFAIKHPHEYISVDDLKFFRRRKPKPDCHTRSSVCLFNNDTGDKVRPFGPLNTEYTANFHGWDVNAWPTTATLLRRSTSLRLEGSMHHLSEHREQYHWYTPEDWRICRSHPIKNPETLCFDDNAKMMPEYRSSYISYPMIDRTMQIRPREMFRIDPDPDPTVTSQRSKRCAAEAEAIQKLSDDKFKRDLAAKEQQKCHLQLRANCCESKSKTMPSEYRRQFVQFPIEKAHSIPQISHIKMQGKFSGIPEYQDSYRMYASYSKSAPIKKVDNLRISGAEALTNTDDNCREKVPEYQEKFCNPPKVVATEKSCKVDDHLKLRGEFSKDVPEYYESFGDPGVKDMPERGKCREPYLRLKGKIEFNPEYRNTYLDFPRSRPIVRKPASTFRLPVSTTSASVSSTANVKSPRHHRYGHDPTTTTTTGAAAVATDITATPEYRRAHYNYQLRERTPNRKFVSVDGHEVACHGKSSDSSAAADKGGKQQQAPACVNRRRPSRHRQNIATDCKGEPMKKTSFENVSIANPAKKPVRFGRRASVLQNCGNMKHCDRDDCGSSFVVLDEPCKRTNWMRKSWYDS